MGKYGTNLEGFGAFEGGVNADKGAPLVSTSSDGETALLFGPAALREIQAGVANGDFAIPPDAAGDTITAENPLPYWTFTDVNSAGAITCAVVADATAGSGNVLRWSVAASTPSGKSATLTRFVPVASTQNRAFVYVAEMTNKASATTNTISKRITQRYYKQDFTTTGADETASAGFNTTLDTLGRSVSTFDISAPADAAFLLITITISTNSTTPASVTTNDLFEVRMIRGEQTLLISEATDPATYFPARITQGNGVLSILPGVSTEIMGNLEVLDGGFGQGNLEVEGDLTVGATTQLNGANSLWVSRASVASATQSFTNNTGATVLLDTASTTPTTGTYDPKSWFNNANDRIAIGKAGFYTVTANIAFAANATGRRIVSINVNGTEVTSTTAMATPTGSSILCCTTNLYLAVNDLVTMSGLQTSGGALSTVVVAGAYPALSVGRIGA
jgi:hypothetical protein